MHKIASKTLKTNQKTFQPSRLYLAVNKLVSACDYRQLQELEEKREINSCSVIGRQDRVKATLPNNVSSGWRHHQAADSSMETGEFHGAEATLQSGSHAVCGLPRRAVVVCWLTQAGHQRSTYGHVVIFSHAWSTNHRLPYQHVFTLRNIFICIHHKVKWMFCSIKHYRLRQQFLAQIYRPN